MAVTCKKKSSEGSLAAKYTENERHEVFTLVSEDVPVQDADSAYASALLANPSEFPVLGNVWPLHPGSGLYAKRITPVMTSKLGTQWEITVQYLPLEPGEPNRDGVADNPLAWPRTYRWDWIETEEAVREARNVEEFTGGFGRAAGTLGPVVNPAYQEFAEGLFHTVRYPVLVIRWNVATLADITAIDDALQGTTNSDTVFSIGPRRWKYLGIEDGDVQYHNEIQYRPVSVRFALLKTTDQEINSLGWKAFSADDGVTLVPAMVNESTETGVITSNRVPASEPQFIGLDGEFTTTAQTITWRFLTEIAYATYMED